MDNENYYVNVVVGNADINGDLDQMGCVCYKFNNWLEAAKLIKLSLDNGLVVEARVPTEALEDQVV